MRLSYYFCALLLTLVALPSTVATAQLGTPGVESVWGGRVWDIAGYAKDATTTRVFVSTESANSLFYADINSASGTFGAFQTVPSVDADDDYGSFVNLIEAHAGSGYVFFSHAGSGLLKTHPSSSTPDVVDAAFATGMHMENDTLLYVAASDLFVSTVDGSGNVSAVAAVNAGVSGQFHSIDVHPYSDSVYVFGGGSSPSLVKTNAKLDALTSSTTVSSIDLSSISGSVEWKGFGIAPSGRLFVVGDDRTSKYVAYSDDESTWTSSSVGNFISGFNVAFQGDSTAYNVYFASYYNATNGTGAWSEFGNAGQETHPNDGPVFADPINSSIVLMTTDQGIGASTDGGPTIFEIDDGLEAVQVKDFDMVASKTEGWLASKSGVRHVTNFLSAASWSGALFPMGDGAPYESIEIDPQDSGYVYAGNNRVYRTTDGGGTWTRLFTPEDPPYNYPMVGSRALTIEVSPFDSLVVFAGFEVDGSAGGLFYSHDRGTNWDQLLLQASSVGFDVNVEDIVFTVEGSDSLAYIGTNGNSVYKLTKSGSTWSVTADMGPSGTSTGSTIVSRIIDLEDSVTGDTLFAVGTDYGINHPIAYFKDLTASPPLWTPLTTSGFPFVSGKQATAASVGGDTLFVGVDHEVYSFKAGDSSWSLGYSYPVGTEINMLFYDELLVGTGTGMYAHFNHGTATDTEPVSAELPQRVTLDQNYPNPFNPATVISYSLPRSARTSLMVYDALGRRVAQLVDGVQTAGSHQVSVDASEWAGGAYLYVLDVDGRAYTGTMVLVK